MSRAAEVQVGDVTYRAVPLPHVRYPAPEALRSWAVWAVTEDDGRGERCVGWIADDPGWSSWPEGAGGFALFIGGTRLVPRLSYVSNCASAREGARRAGQTCVRLRAGQARSQSREKEPAGLRAAAVPERRRWFGWLR